MAVTSANDVVNLALGYLGEAPVSDYTTDTEPAAEAANRVFDETRDKVLRSHPWSFATRVSGVLTDSTDDADDDWSYKYALPTGCLKVSRVFDDDRTASDLEFTLRHTAPQDINVLVTDIDDCRIEFLYQETTVANWDSCFIEALSYRLAADLVGSVTDNMAMRQQMLQMYQWSMNQAKQLDSSEQRVDTVDNGNQGFVDARI